MKLRMLNPAISSIMRKSVKCRSGITGWQCKLQENYADQEEFERWSDMYGLAQRLGYEDTEDCWNDNPTIQGSVIPDDFRVVKHRIKK